MLDAITTIKVIVLVVLVAMLAGLLLAAHATLCQPDMLGQTGGTIATLSILAASLGVAWLIVGNPLKTD